MDNTNKDNLDVLLSNRESFWLASAEPSDYPALKEDIDVDVAIIGGGLVGITSGYILKNKGYKVAILEAGRIAHGTTGHTTAKITSQHGLIYNKLLNEFGEEKAKQYADSNEYAIHFIANLIKEKNIDCDFKWQPAYIYTQSEDYISDIESEVRAASRLGLKASFMDKLPLPFDIKAAVKFEEQAQFHPLKYVSWLAKAIPGDGSQIYEFTKVVDVKDADDKDGRHKCTVITSDGKNIAAAKVIVASHFPCYDGFGLYFARMYAEKSYAIGVTLKNDFPEGMYITAEDPGRSLRSQPLNDKKLIIIGGEHHKTGSEKDTNVHYENLANFARDTFDLKSILFRWSTQDCMTADKVPYIGYLTSKTNNILVATGFKKWGMTTSTASAIILSDLISKGDSPWAEVYDPSRFNPSASAVNMITQNLDVARNLIGGKLYPAPKNVDIQNCEAKIISYEGNKFGAYKDEDGALHMVDATCTHLGCELVWNEAEKTWDCPCHGSRFSIDGENVEGPAFNPLHHPGEPANKKDANVF